VTRRAIVVLTFTLVETLLKRALRSSATEAKESDWHYRLSSMI
jgi:hypothetical protein